MTEDASFTSTAYSLRKGSATSVRHSFSERVLGKVTHIAVIDTAVQPNVKGETELIMSFK